jgi:hypothetical protein
MGVQTAPDSDGFINIKTRFFLGYLQVINHLKRIDQMVRILKNGESAELLSKPEKTEGAKARGRRIAPARSFTEPTRVVETRLGPTVRREAARNIFFASQMAFIRGRDYRYV